MSFHNIFRGIITPTTAKAASISTLSLFLLSESNQTTTSQTNNNNYKSYYYNNKIQCDDDGNNTNAKKQDILNIPELIHEVEQEDHDHEHERKAGFLGGKDTTQSYHNLFPLRQLFQPVKPYPLWDDNWDNKLDERQNMPSKQLRKNGKTRHIILIRHGQYDETHSEDEKKILTPLGREQAKLTGIRLAEMIKGATDEFGPCTIKALHVSNLARAKETADIISEYILPLQTSKAIVRTEPDPLLNEGRPCHHIPTGKVTPSIISKTDEQHARIEAGFSKYIYTASPPSPSSEEEDSKHEFEIIVCHGNVIRYFFCRALQLPPEAWLRLCTFNCSLTYFTVRPSGSVSCRMLGDIGHLGYNNSTFSMHHGFNW